MARNPTAPHIKIKPPSASPTQTPRSAALRHESLLPQSYLVAL
jgi:hypothetical protein